MIQVAACAIRIDHDATTKASHSQLLFGRYIQINILCTPTWESITTQIQKEIIKNTTSGNKRRMDHNYKTNHNVTETVYLESLTVPSLVLLNDSGIYKCNSTHPA